MSDCRKDVERETFEQTFGDQYTDFERFENGEYMDDFLQQSWIGWQAIADKWIKCSEQTPNSGQRVILQSNGVIQNYMPLFEQGDSDFGMGDYFWDFEDINDIDNPLVDFEEDCWMPLPKPPKQEKSHD